MDLLPADYVLLGLTAVLAVLGLFRGFSGTLAFVIASAAAALTAPFVWIRSAAYLAAPWTRALAVLVLVLLVFGLVRLIVRKLVNGLLAQPSDAIFGFVVGVLSGLLLVAAWAYGGFYLEYSALATGLSAYVR